MIGIRSCHEEIVDAAVLALLLNPGEQQSTWR